MLATWMRALNDSLGDCRFTPAGSFRVHFETKPGEMIIKSSGSMKFEKGTATSDLVFVHGKIVSFSIDSDRLDKDWFQGPTETTFYQQRGEVVIRWLLERRLDEMKRVVHPALLEAAGDETLNHIGDLGDKGVLDATVTFTFDGLKGHLTAFNIQPAE